MTRPLTEREASKLRQHLRATARALGLPPPRPALERLREAMEEEPKDRAWKDLEEPGCRRRRKL